MTDTTHDLRVSARTARLSASDGDAADSPPYTFSGVAVAAGDILHMEDGTPVLFTEDELRAAAETQAGEPLTVDHPSDDSGRPLYPPPTEETIGRVPKAGWLESQHAVGYEATTHDEAIAEGVQAESYEVSVHPTFELGEQDPDTGAYVAENIQFRDLSVVSKGDSPSNTAQWGPNQALAAYTREADIGAELTVHDDTAGDCDDGDGAREGTIASTVRGTLRALGFDPDDQRLDGRVDGDGGEVVAVDEGAESPTGNSGSTDMDDRDNIISTLVDEHDFNQEWLEDAEDDHIERLHESLADSDDDRTDTPPTTDEDDGPETGDDGSGGLAEMTVDELAAGLQERGFVTKDTAPDLVEQAQAQASKAETVEELIAASETYDEADRDALLASADKLVEREHQRLRGEGAATLPGTAGGLTAAAPEAEDAEDELEAYGTGVQEDSE